MTRRESRKARLIAPKLIREHEDIALYLLSWQIQGLIQVVFNS